MIHEKDIALAVAELGSEDRKRREAAFEALVRAGRPAVGHLIQVLMPVGPRTRREALRLLGQLAPPDAENVPEAADVFVVHLEDEDGDSRWLAAEGLVALGEPGLHRALVLLADASGSAWSRRGAHHVLEGLRRQGFEELVAPVLAAFRSDIPGIDVPKAALHALSELEVRRHRAR